MLNIIRAYLLHAASHDRQVGRQAGCQEVSHNTPPQWAGKTAKTRGYISNCKQLCNFSSTAFTLYITKLSFCLC